MSKRVALAILTLSATLLFSGCGAKEVVPAGAPEYVNTYLKTDLMEVSAVKEKLTAAGFEILGETKVGKKMTNIVVTHPALIALADRPTRGMLAGAIRVLVNPEDKMVLINNPFYYIKAYLQNEYKEGDEKIVQDAMMQAFPNAVGTKDQWKYDGLSTYHFMVGMPYYNEQLNLSEGDSVDALVKKATKHAKKNLVFTRKLSENRYLLGLHLSKRTSKFPNKIGTDKSNILPWNVLIEMVEKDGKQIARATALRAEYQIAISYPLLDLGGFANIMTVPGAVDKDLSKYFK